MIQTLKNDLLSVKISSHGAELQNITDIRSGYEYLWQGDSRYWGRRSPVLFPIVGAVRDGKFTVDGKEYPMSQHGFARDREFEVMNDVPDDEAWFRLESDEQSMEVFPRRFALEIGYQLQEERLRVMWRVRNTGDSDLYFQIGAHPAFNYPDFNAAYKIHGYFSLDARDIVSGIIETKGCVGHRTKQIVLDRDSLLPLEADTFAEDALILEHGQVHRVSMLDKTHKPYLTLLFDAPLVGLWSPKPDAPFVCIEPWWGRCDSVDFDGEFSERAYVNRLAPGAVFNASYMIIIDSI